MNTTAAATVDPTASVNWQKVYEDAFWAAMDRGMCEGEAEQYANVRSDELRTLCYKTHCAN